MVFKKQEYEKNQLLKKLEILHKSNNKKKIDLLKYELNKAKAEIQFYCITENIALLQYIDNKSAEICEKALKTPKLGLRSIQYFKDFESCPQLMDVLKIDGSFIRFIKEPTPEQMIQSLITTPMFIFKNYKNIDNDIVLKSLPYNMHIMKYLEHPTEEQQDLFISSYGFSELTYIKNPSIKTQLLFVNSSYFKEKAKNYRYLIGYLANQKESHPTVLNEALKYTEYVPHIKKIKKHKDYKSTVSHILSIISSA